MRVSSPEISDPSSATSDMTRRRRKHRRRILPNSRKHNYEEEEDEEFSPPDSRRYDSGADRGADDADAEDGVTGSTEPGSSYSDYQRSSGTPARGRIGTSGGSSAWSSPDPRTPTAPPPSAYVNVAPLPIFRGAPGECPVAHLARFARVCRANNASAEETMLRIFPVTLDGEAALWYELEVDPRRPSLSWEETESSFLRAYRRPEESADRCRSELVAMRQGEEETVNGYYLRMRWILKKWPDHGVPDAVLRGIFVDGLREDFQDWVVPHQPESLEEAFRLALCWEQAQGVRSARQRNAVRCGFCDGPHQESTCDVRRRMRELWRKNREGPPPLETTTSPPPPKIGDCCCGGGGGITQNIGNLRSLSLPAVAAVRREGEEGGEGGGRVLSVRRSQCLCTKHECWKKHERISSGSLLERRNPTAPD